MRNQDDLSNLFGIPLSPDHHQAVSSMRNGLFESLLGREGPSEWTFGENMGREDNASRGIGNVMGMTPYALLGALAASGLMAPLQHAIPTSLYNVGLGGASAAAGLVAREVVTGGESPESIAKGTAFGTALGPFAGRMGSILDDLMLAAYGSFNRDGGR